MRSHAGAGGKNLGQSIGGDAAGVDLDECSFEVDGPHPGSELAQGVEFGLVLIEALACGLPVAAFPAPGPQDVVGESGCGIISEDLRAAALAALRIDRNLCRRQAESFTWERATTQFLANVRQAHLQPRERARAA